MGEKLQTPEEVVAALRHECLDMYTAPDGYREAFLDVYKTPHIIRNYGQQVAEAVRDEVLVYISQQCISMSANLAVLELDKKIRVMDLTSMVGKKEVGEPYE